MTLQNALASGLVPTFKRLSYLISTGGYPEFYLIERAEWIALQKELVALGKQYAIAGGKVLGVPLRVSRHRQSPIGN